jgi:hypothetical protein
MSFVNVVGEGVRSVVRRRRNRAVDGRRTDQRFSFRLSAVQPHMFMSLTFLPFPTRDRPNSAMPRSVRILATHLGTIPTSILRARV